MSSIESEQFLDRVFDHIGGLESGDFSATSWAHAGRPTSEGLGLKCEVSVDPEKIISCALDVEHYHGNISYVEKCTINEKFSDTDFVYTQWTKLPVLGTVQVALRMKDAGERDGFRIVVWEQDNAVTEALNKKQGARMAYDLGAWLVKEDKVAYALAAGPVKKDVGSLKYKVMTKGADATGQTVISKSINAMISWSERV